MNTEDHPLLFDVGAPKPTTMVEVELEPPKTPEQDRTQVMVFEPPVCGATFSEDRKFRYRLFRRFRENGPTLVFLALNCSRADEEKSDPTVTRMEGYARRDGYACLVVANLCAFVATDPRDMKAAEDPGGPDHPRNVEAVLEAAREAERVCLAWGNHGQWRNYGRRMYDMLIEAGLGHKLCCLKVTKQGEPSHCLYLRSDLLFAPFSYDSATKQSVVFEEDF